MVKATCYRVAQFFRALTAPRSVSKEDIERATSILTPEARALFRRQSAQDQRHALAVYKALHQAGHTNPQLLAAALLHDVGKTAAELSAWQRGVFVLAEHLIPGMLARIIGEEPGGWRRPFADYARHEEVGARWAEEVGCSALTVALILRHEDHLEECQTKEDQLLAALQAADNAN